MENSSKGSKVVKWVLIGVSFLFIAIMLILPLITVLTEAFKDGIKVFYQAVTDKYTVDGVYSKDDFIEETSELNHLTNQDELHAGDYLTIAYYSTEIK